MNVRLRVDLTIPLERFTLRAAFDSEAATLGIFGPSGAGKTTILEAIAGLRRASGVVEFEGERWLDSSRGIDLPPHRRGVGYVAQDALLFPHWSVEGNILAGRRRADASNGRGGKGRSRASAAGLDAILDLFDLRGLRASRVESLSGGEARRVALARALCSGPSLLLLDEPLASIEAALRGRILSYLLRVRDEFSVPTILVTHDATEVTILCGDVVVLREGAVAGCGRPSDLFTTDPGRTGVEGAGYENIIEGIVETCEAGTATISVSGRHRFTIAFSTPVAPGARVLAGVKAGDLMIATGEAQGLSARNVVPGIVRLTHACDGGVMVMVALGEGAPDLAVLVTEAARFALSLQTGSAVRLVAKAQSFRILALR